MEENTNWSADAGAQAVQKVRAQAAALTWDMDEEFGPAFLNPAKKAEIVRMSDVSLEAIGWLWERWIPSRMMTILGGHGGDGKSTVMVSLIGALTTGGALPDGSTARVTNVLMLSAEDDPSYAIRPRLDLHGTDPGRVFVLKGTKRSTGRTTWFDLRWDVDVMRDVIREHDIGLVVVDPLSSYMPKMDRNGEADIREALRPLMELMQETGVGVVGIMHIGKGRDSRRENLGLLESTAFTAMARSILMLADQPDERQPDDVATGGKLRVLEVTKSNHSIPPPPIAFRRPLDAPVSWLGVSGVGVAECLVARSKSSGPVAMNTANATKLLRKLLKDGPVATKKTHGHCPAARGQRADVAAGQKEAGRRLQSRRRWRGMAVGAAGRPGGRRLPGGAPQPCQWQP